MARINPINILILTGILLILLGEINARVIDVNLVFYDDSVQENYVIVADKIPVEMGEDYVLEVLSSDGDVIKRRELQIPSGTEGSIGTLNMRLSYREGMKILRLLHNGKEIYSRNLLAYASGEVPATIPATTSTLPTTSTVPIKPLSTPATTSLKVFNCGNSICDEMENYKNCPEDCPSGSLDRYCDGLEDTICDPDCYRWEDPDCESHATISATPTPTTTPTSTTPSTTTTPIIPTTTPATVPATISTTIPTTIPTTSSTITLTTSTTSTTSISTTIKAEEKEGNSSLLYAGAVLVLLAVIAIAVIRVRSMRTLRKVDDGELKYWIEGKLKTGENPALLKKALEKQGSDPKIVDEIMQKIWKNNADVV